MLRESDNVKSGRAFAASGANMCFSITFFLISESQKVGKGESFFFFDYAKKTVETVCYLYLDFK